MNGAPGHHQETTEAKKSAAMSGVAAVEEHIPSRRKWIHRLILASILIVIIEIASYVGLRLLDQRYPMDPMAAIDRERVEVMLTNYYDPGLGWNYDRVQHDLNDIHARSAHEYADFGKTISVYGDSYAYGMDVPVADAWATLLEKASGVGVINFGVPAYGTDQALLRLEEKYSRVPSPTVLLCVLTENINRCVGIYGGFYRRHFYALKPRFVLEDGVLELYKPASSAAEARDIMLDHPDRLIEIARGHDHWYDELEWRGGPWRITPPYSLQLAVRIPYCLRRLKVGITDVGIHVPLYAEGTESLEIMKAIIARFRDFADRRSFNGLVVIFPTVRDARTMAAHGAVGHQTLLDFLDAEHIPYLDLLDVIARQPDIASLYVDGIEHLTRAGGEIVVPEILDFLRKNDALPGG